MTGPRQRKLALGICLLVCAFQAAIAGNAPPPLPQLATFDGAGVFKGEQAVVTASAEESGPILRVAFSASQGYPAVVFQGPPGGWNLSAYQGVVAEMRNPGKGSVTVGVRAETRTPDKAPSLAFEQKTLAPGERQTVLIPFKSTTGVDEKAVDPAHVTTVHVYLVQPPAAGELILTNLRATENAASGADSPSAERSRPVTLPAWIGQRPPVPGNWKLTFDENFDGEKLDGRHWSPRLSWNGFLPTWKARYSPKNVSVRGGQLELLVEKKTGPADDDPSKPTRDITSGAICTLDKWKQAYGYFEARIKLPTSPGLWPAFWMMPDHGQGAPKRESTGDGGMEFDVVEHLTEWGPGRYNTAVHWGDYGKDHQSWANNYVYHGPTPDGWHVWGMLWEPGRVTWYCDGAKKSVFEGPMVGRVPAYLILNVQSGGWAKAPIDPARMPDRMLVDYVRAWQTADRIEPPR